MLLFLLLTDNMLMWGNRNQEQENRNRKQGNQKQEQGIKTYVLTMLLVLYALIFMVPAADANWEAINGGH